MRTLCIHYYISGKVQGVWYRANTQKIAIALGLTGWVRNLPDGRVEVMAYGQPEVLEQFHAWLRQGPELAEVSEVTSELVEIKEFNEFSILP